MPGPETLTQRVQAKMDGIRTFATATATHAKEIGGAISSVSQNPAGSIFNLTVKTGNVLEDRLGLDGAHTDSAILFTLGSSLPIGLCLAALLLIDRCYRRGSKAANVHAEAASTWAGMVADATRPPTLAEKRVFRPSGGLSQAGRAHGHTLLWGFDKRVSDSEEEEEEEEEEEAVNVSAADVDELHRKASAQATGDRAAGLRGKASYDERRASRFEHEDSRDRGSDLGSSDEEHPEGEEEEHRSSDDSSDDDDEEEENEDEDDDGEEDEGEERQQSQQQHVKEEVARAAVLPRRTVESDHDEVVVSV
jgi:hypothetical protein